MQKSNATANTLFMYGPFVLGAFVMVASNPLFLIVAIGVLYLIGVSRLIISKRSLFRNGIWFSFGPGLMDAQNRRHYFSGYRVIAVGILINLASLSLYT